jgi:hypothetical protein
MQAMEIRSLGGMAPPRPSALPGMISGAAIVANPASRINLRRELIGFSPAQDPSAPSHDMSNLLRAASSKPQQAAGNRYRLLPAINGVVLADFPSLGRTVGQREVISIAKW